jgi:hypothetical protein
MNEMSDDLLIAITSEGTTEFIYNDEFAELLRSGPHTVERVSNVEYETVGLLGSKLIQKSGWVATMKNGLKIGPYETREEALKAEVAHLEEKMF